MPIPTVCVIAAVSLNGVIGHAGRIPWHLPGDFAYFKSMTLGYPTIMGRKTYESIGRALPQRPAIVISNSVTDLPDATVVSQLDNALHVAAAHGTGRVFIIGGSRVYTEALDQGVADVVYLTVVMTDVEGTVRFPHIRSGVLHHPHYVLAEQGPVIQSQTNDLQYRFDTYRWRHSDGA